MFGLTSLFSFIEVKNTMDQYTGTLIKFLTLTWWPFEIYSRLQRGSKTLTHIDVRLGLFGEHMDATGHQKCHMERS